MPTLRILRPDSTEATYVLRGEKITVGRRPDNAIQIIDRSVSAHHAELVLVDGHYRLHDLGSTNQTFVDDQPVTDFHLHAQCKITFGTVACLFDLAVSEPDAALTPAQMEKDGAFLRAENQELRNKNDVLQRRIDMLSSARLITAKNDAPTGGGSEDVKRLAAERDEMRFQNSGLKVELEKVRGELSVVLHERDAARQAHQLLLMQLERVQPVEEVPQDNKGATQRIIFRVPATRE